MSLNLFFLLLFIILPILQSKAKKRDHPFESTWHLHHIENSFAIKRNEERKKRDLVAKGKQNFYLVEKRRRGKLCSFVWTTNIIQSNGHKREMNRKKGTVFLAIASFHLFCKVVNRMTSSISLPSLSLPRSHSLSRSMPMITSKTIHERGENVRMVGMSLHISFIFNLFFPFFFYNHWLFFPRCLCFQLKLFEKERKKKSSVRGKMSKVFRFLFNLLKENLRHDFFPEITFNLSWFSILFFFFFVMK